MSVMIDSVNDNPRLVRLLPGMPGVKDDVNATLDETLSDQDSEINLVIIVVQGKPER